VLGRRRFEFLDSDFCAGVKIAAPIRDLRPLIRFRTSRSWIGARLAAEADYSVHARVPPKAFPKKASRSRCCSIRVVSRILSDIRPTRRWVNSGIFCTRLGNSEAGKRRTRGPLLLVHRRELLHFSRRVATPVTSPAYCTKIVRHPVRPALQLSLKDNKHRVRGIALANVCLAPLRCNSSD